MSEGERLDNALFLSGLCESREKAKALIMAGQVFVNGNKEIKPGTRVKPMDSFEVRGAPLAFVSRGGLKLEKALKEFPVILTDKICMDVGASTGGFTDCMLQNGAAKVYAVDVGYGQLAWKLRTDERVVVLERTNFRYISSEQVSEPIGFASVDVSFISLKLILPVLAPLLTENGQAVVLIKPQFEAGREKVGKKGVVRDPAVHEEVIASVCAAARDCGFSVLGLSYSPIRGPQGNIEYLLYLIKGEQNAYEPDIARLVADSHRQWEETTV